MFLFVCCTITGFSATVQWVITEIQSAGIWIHYLWILQMSPVWPVLNRKSADGFTQCLFFSILSLFFSTLAYTKYNCPPCTWHLTIRTLSFSTIFTTVLVRFIVASKKYFTAWPRFTISPDFIIVSQPVVAFYSMQSGKTLWLCI